MGNSKFYVNKEKVIACSIHDYERDTRFDPVDVSLVGVFGKIKNKKTFYGYKSLDERIETKEAFEASYPNHKIKFGVCVEKPHVILLLSGVNNPVYHYFETYGEVLEWAKINIPKEMITY